MAFAVTLEYPNGRSHEAVLDRAQAPELDTEFEMFGHRWRVTRLIDSRHANRLLRRANPAAESPRYLCVCVS